MNQKCQVCGERAAGYHFGAFTCEGCKSFFGRSYNNPSITECKNNGKCIIDKKNRTTCKACRLAKCYAVNMSKGGSRYGRRPNSFKIQYLLQEQQQQAAEAAGFGDMAAAIATAMAQQHMQCNSHLAAAQHMGGFLAGYPGFLPDMMQNCSPFMGMSPPGAAAAGADRRAADPSNPNAIPFMNMFGSLPIAPPHQQSFHLPAHLMFPGYHPNTMSSSSASSANTTPICHSEMFKHRQSVESFVSGDSIQRYSPGMRSSSACTDDDRQSPELCVAEELPVAPATPPAQAHTIHAPIARRAIPKDNDASESVFQPISQSIEEKCATPRASPSSRSSARSVSTSPTTMAPTATATATQATAPIDAANDLAGHDEHVVQDTPIDLSMKAATLRLTPANRNASPTSSAASIGNHDDDDDRADDLYRDHANMRRKFCQFQSEQESDSAASQSSITHVDGIKRQRRLTASDFNAFAHNAAAAAASVTSLRGIFAGV